LGTDDKVFEHLRLNARMKFIPWIRPLKQETIYAYAKRMSEPIRDTRPVLLGVSFGGMIGIEMARQMAIEKLIIISSVKSSSELPRWMRIAGNFQLYKMLPTRSYKWTEKFDNKRLGVTNDQEKKLVDSYRKKMDPVYFDWAIHQIFNWKNDWYPDNIIHIHGENDKIFPVRRLKPTHLIKDGTHIMLLNKARELSECINSVL
jgi:pimeloyl-ACP methyl ester carboxylesterase